MLDSHPDLAIPSETHFLPALFELPAPASAADALHAMTSSSTWPNMAVDAAKLEEACNALRPFSTPCAARAFYGLYAARFGKRRWGDKTPPYRRYLASIQACLPEAHFIHLIRDGRDAALSHRGLWFGPEDDIAAQARFWVDEISAARRHARDCEHYIEVRYEDLIREPEATLRSLCTFLRLDYCAELLDYHVTASERLNEYKAPFGPSERRPSDVAAFIAIHERTRHPPDIGRTGRWRLEMPEREQKRYEAIAGDLLRSLGYETLSSG